MPSVNNPRGLRNWKRLDLKTKKPSKVRDLKDYDQRVDAQVGRVEQQVSIDWCARKRRPDSSCSRFSAREHLYSRVTILGREKERSSLSYLRAACTLCMEKFVFGTCHGTDACPLELTYRTRESSLSGRSWPIITRVSIPERSHQGPYKYEYAIELFARHFLRPYQESIAILHKHQHRRPIDHPGKIYPDFLLNPFSAFYRCRSDQDSRVSRIDRTSRFEKIFIIVGLVSIHIDLFIFTYFIIR